MPPLLILVNFKIEVSSYNSSKSIGPGTPDPNILSKSPRQTPMDNPHYNTSPNIRSTRKNSGAAGTKYATTGHYVSTENYLSKSPNKAGGLGHARKASTASSTGYITTEAYNSSNSNRTSNNSRDNTGGRYSGIDEETPLFADGKQYHL